MDTRDLIYFNMKQLGYMYNQFGTVQDPKGFIYFRMEHQINITKRDTDLFIIVCDSEIQQRGQDLWSRRRPC